MSSILRALKKLETETRPPAAKAEDVHWPAPIDTRKAIRDRVKSTYFLNRLIYGLFVLFLIGGGTWLFWFQKQTPPKPTPSGGRQAPVSTARKPVPPPSTPAVAKPAEPSSPTTVGNVVRHNPDKALLPSAKTPAKATTPAKPAVPAPPITTSPKTVAAKPSPSAPPNKTVPTPSHKATSTQPEKSVRKPSPPAAPSTPAPAAPASKPAVALKTEAAGTTPEIHPPPAVSPPKPASQPPQRKPTPATPDRSPKSAPAASATDRRPRQAPAPPAPATPKPVTPTPAADEAAAYADVPVGTAETVGLQVQALVWSEDEASRLAVINGTIVKTGGDVDGNVVRFIGEDFVIIQKGPRNWKLKFQLK